MSENRSIKAKCPNGHFYNQSKYASCPYCAILNLSRKEEDVPPQEEAASDVSDAFVRDVSDIRGNQETAAEQLPADVSVYSSGQDDVPDDTPEEMPEDTPEDDDVRTVSFYTAESVDPVVGWVVCIKGKHFGDYFELFAGRNEIGRSAGKDISLYDEPSISKKTHAVVIFEPRHRTFYIQAGDSHGLTYLNGEMIVSHQQMIPGSIVTLGDVVFKFIPLCGEDFDWNDVERYCQ